METVVRDNDLVTHKVHRHEPPVSAAHLKVIHEDEHFVVIDKPSSIPVCSTAPPFNDILNTVHLYI